METRIEIGQIWENKSDGKKVLVREYSRYTESVYFVSPDNETMVPWRLPTNEFREYFVRNAECGANPAPDNL